MTKTLKRTKKEKYLKTAEVAALAGITVQTLYSYTKSGYGPQPVIEGSGVYRKSDVENWMASRPGRGWRGKRSK